MLTFEGEPTQVITGDFIVWDTDLGGIFYSRDKMDNKKVLKGPSGNTFIHFINFNCELEFRFYAQSVANACGKKIQQTVAGDKNYPAFQFI